MKSDQQISRSIVAMLLWRYRFARTLMREYQKVNDDEMTDWNTAQMFEMWNAYVIAERIMNGEEL